MEPATSTLATIGGSIVTTVVDLATTVFTDYWPYILVAGVIVALAAGLKKLVFAGTK